MKKVSLEEVACSPFLKYRLSQPILKYKLCSPMAVYSIIFCTSQSAGCLLIAAKKFASYSTFRCCVSYICSSVYPSIHPSFKPSPFLSIHPSSPKSTLPHSLAVEWKKLPLKDHDVIWYGDDDIVMVKRAFASKFRQKIGLCEYIAVHIEHIVHPYMRYTAVVCMQYTVRVWPIQHSMPVNTECVSGGNTNIMVSVSPLPQPSPLSVCSYWK